MRERTARTMILCYDQAREYLRNTDKHLSIYLSTRKVTFKMCSRTVACSSHSFPSSIYYRETRDTVCFFEMKRVQNASRESHNESQNDFFVRKVIHSSVLERVWDASFVLERFPKRVPSILLGLVFGTRFNMRTTVGLGLVRHSSSLNCVCRAADCSGDSNSRDENREHRVGEQTTLKSSFRRHFVSFRPEMNSISESHFVSFRSEIVCEMKRAKRT